MNKLTNKQEAFAQKYVESGIAAKAYKEVYSTDNMKDNTVYREAYELVHTHKISTRIQEIKQELRDELSISTADIDKVYELAIGMAFIQNDPATIIRGNAERSKLHGLVTDKSINVNTNLNEDVTAKQKEVAKRMVKRESEKVH